MRHARPYPTAYFTVRTLSTTPPDVTWLDRYVDVSGNLSASPVWLTDAQIDDLVAQELRSGAMYRFAVKAAQPRRQRNSLFSKGPGTVCGSVLAADADIRVRGARLRSEECLC